jgi:hypothetical protein
MNSKFWVNMALLTFTVHSPLGVHAQPQQTKKLTAVETIQPIRWIRTVPRLHHSTQRASY